MRHAVLATLLSGFLSLTLAEPLTIEAPSSAYNDSNYLFANIASFYPELVLARDKKASVFCPLLKDHNLATRSLAQYFYIVLSVKHLGCSADLAEAAQAASKAISSDNFRDYYYAMKILQGVKGDFISHCAHLRSFISERGQFRTTATSEQANYHASAVATDLLVTCEAQAEAPQLPQFLSEVQKGLTRLGDTSAWLAGKNTFFVTLKILNLLLMKKVVFDQPQDYAGLLRFVSRKLPLSLAPVTQVEYNVFAELSRRIEVIDTAPFLNWELCQERCKLTLAPPHVYHIRLTAGDQVSELETNAEGEFLLPPAEIETVHELRLELVDAAIGWILAVNRIAVFKANRLLRVAARVSEAPSVVEDLDGISCAAEIKATGGDFLTFAFQLQRPADFVFVELTSPEATSASLLASRDEDTGVYVASFDLGDYETIKPISGTYTIAVVADEWSGVIGMPGNRFECGRVRVAFAQQVADDQEKVKLHWPEVYVPPRRAPLLLPIYFTAVTLAFYGLHASVVRRYFSELNGRPTSGHLVLLAVAIVLFVHTLVLALRENLIESIWMVAVEVLVFSGVALVVLPVSVHPQTKP